MDLIILKALIGVTRIEGMKKREGLREERSERGRKGKGERKKDEKEERGR